MVYTFINRRNDVKMFKSLVEPRAVGEFFFFTAKQLKVSVNENFSTLLDFVFFYFGHEWVLYFILAEKENQKVLFNPSKMSLF